MEILFTDYYLLNADYVDVIEELIQYREEIAHYDYFDDLEYFENKSNEISNIFFFVPDSSMVVLLRLMNISLNIG